MSKTWHTNSQEDKYIQFIENGKMEYAKVSRTRWTEKDGVKTKEYQLIWGEWEGERIYKDANLCVLLGRKVSEKIRIKADNYKLRLELKGKRESLDHYQKIYIKDVKARYWEKATRYGARSVFKKIEKMANDKDFLAVSLISDDKIEREIAKLIIGNENE